MDRKRTPMTDLPAKKQCDRCGAKAAACKLFRIPWTGDCLCKNCIDRDRSLQQMFAEIDSMEYDRHLRNIGIPTDLPDGMDVLAYILEPDDQ